MNELRKCSVCKCNQLLNENNFKKNHKDEFNKSCIRCAERRSTQRENNKCCHDKRKNRCIDCNGSQICIHKRERTSCIDCGGASICIHKRQRRQCIDCGGASTCIHKRQRSQCIDCGGASICIHKRVRSQCIDCNLPGYLLSVASSRINRAKIPRNGKSTTELLGCTKEDFVTHIENQFVEGMDWNNRELWDIDHRIPINYKNPETNELPTIEEIMARLHFTNTKPMWKVDNRSKGSRYID